LDRETVLALFLVVGGVNVRAVVDDGVLADILLVDLCVISLSSPTCARR